MQDIKNGYNQIVAYNIHFNVFYNLQLQLHLESSKTGNVSKIICGNLLTLKIKDFNCMFIARIYGYMISSTWLCHVSRVKDLKSVSSPWP